MNLTEQEQEQSRQTSAKGQAKGRQSSDLEAAITSALSKIGGKRKNDICKYLPVSGGGYMHHFTFRKMENECPHELKEMVDTFINNCESPGRVAPKPRAARGSRKQRRDVISCKREDLEQLMEIARQTNDPNIHNLLNRLAPPKSREALKKDLIKGIREEWPAQKLCDLFSSFIQMLSVHQAQGESQATVNTPGVVGANPMIFSQG